ncbi:hypothetical protein P280DRAFT_466582 [Massarina eburnea CBS 473.64]|uniref:Uncharacterized protein n=1 Tax=Massarina eburnea CBS 473.64 TaxID=1395130 RepID=A0A6A6S839_9PLEO|nr:hypothetical protein P280DRAFT_466582 [Massarina eburnea CBS 473.64]
MASSATNSEDVAIDARSRSALATTKRNLRYLYDPKTAPQAVSSRRTRAALRVVRSAVIFVFWRAVRYAKYVAIGSLVATLSAGVFGTFVSGAGFVLAPTGIAGTIVAGTIWGVGRYAMRKVKTRWWHGHGYEDQDAQRDERIGGVRGEYRGPESMPW